MLSREQIAERLWAIISGPAYHNRDMGKYDPVSHPLYLDFADAVLAMLAEEELARDAVAGHAKMRIAELESQVAALREFVGTRIAHTEACQYAFALANGMKFGVSLCDCGLAAIMDRTAAAAQAHDGKVRDDDRGCGGWPETEEQAVSPLTPEEHDALHSMGYGWVADAVEERDALAEENRRLREACESALHEIESQDLNMGPLREDLRAALAAPREGEA